jgi:predicted  nucleic acid-binding Zn-ribbon protein
LELQFSKLATLRKDVEGLSDNFDRALDALSGAAAGADNADADTSLEEVSGFIKATQSQFDEIERKMITFGQIKTKLGDLQSRLIPLESKDGGIADTIARVQDMRDRLIAKIERLEADENGDLAARVNTFVEARQELEKRVTTVTEHFSKLATIRSDIAGLFDKLSNAADTSSN